MQEGYKHNEKITLTPKITIIEIGIRHSNIFTRGFREPFDEVLSTSMCETMKYLCENIQGCVLGYSYSDKIILVLTNYQVSNTNTDINYMLNLCSLAASMATLSFNRNFARNAMLEPEKGTSLTNAYSKSIYKGALFDARCFKVLKEEVTDHLFIRQQDAIRKSILSAGYTYFSYTQLRDLNSNQIQELLLKEKGVNWNDYSTKFKRGSCCIEIYTTKDHTEWKIDNEIPVFGGDDENYIKNLINI